MTKTMDKPVSKKSLEALRERAAAEGRQEGLLEGVFGPLAADRAAQHRHHLAGVLVDQGLERG